MSFIAKNSSTIADWFVFDVAAGTGSVSVEPRIPLQQIPAVSKDSEDEENRHLEFEVTRPAPAYIPGADAKRIREANQAYFDRLHEQYVMDQERCKRVLRALAARQR